jgi:glycosyltransferase involved in cell wall biosynthesis
MKVSIIIPNYNRASLVKETIDNMLMQTWEDKEIIVVDDGSTDNSVAVLKSYGDRIHLIEQKNQGVGAARNHGLKYASGEFVQFMDSDDLAGPSKIENQARELSERQADIIYGPWIMVKFKDQLVIPSGRALQQGPLPPGRSACEWHASEWSTVLQSCLFRRSILDKAGHFRTDWKVAEDQDIFARCVLAGGKLIYSPNCITLYRLHELEKLTTSGTSDETKTLNWASYLLEARKQLITSAKPTDPVKWSGYRDRVWGVASGLEAFQDKEAIFMKNQLLRLVYGFRKNSISRNKHFVRIRKGIKFRLGGSRYHKCYQTGPLSEFQVKEIEALDYVITEV